MQKVFCIGFHKTGTTSLHEALTILGYRVCSVRKDLVGAIIRGDSAAIQRVVESYDAFEDNPWPLLYQVLDRGIPDARFILTLRDVEAWYQSALAHFGSRETDMRRLIYGADRGAPADHEEAYKRRYTEHYRQVRAHFSGRDNLLEFDVFGGDGWTELCGFLGHRHPTVPFPHANARGARSGPRT